MSRTMVVIMITFAAGSAAAAELFVDVSGSGTACTQASPCALATAVARVAGGDTVYVADGTYTGTGEQVVLLDVGAAFTLQGGWDGAGGGAVVVDAARFVTVLDGENARRVVTILGGSPTIRGFTIRRGNASGLTSLCVGLIHSAAGCGGGIFANNSLPVIESNVIEDNVASAATPVGMWGVGGGVLVLNNWPALRHNVIRRNTASVGATGAGGGVAVMHGTAQTVLQDNEISANTASDGGLGYGGGVWAEYGNVQVLDNLFEGNVAGAAGTAYGAGLYLARGSHTAQHNHVVGNRGDTAVYVFYASGVALVANRVVANPVTTAVRVTPPQTDAPISIANNFISDGTLHNVVVEGTTNQPATAAIVHNTVVGDGRNGGVKLQGTVSATLLNNIVAGHATGIEGPELGTVTVAGTLFWENQDDGVRGTDAVDGSPNLVDRLRRDYHLHVGSSAVDNGVAGAVLPIRDIDAEVRPAAGTRPDIGADELPPTRFDFGSASSPLEPGYTRVTEAERLAWSSGWGWDTGTVASRARAGGTALQRDFNMTRSALFSVALPAATYDVRATFGDASFAHDQMQVTLEGKVVDTIATAKGEFATRTWRVARDGDGHVDLALADLGGTDPNAVINALEVRNPKILKVDFGTAGSPVAPGFVRASHATAYSDAARFGWVSGTVGSRDRGGADPLARDFCLTGNATFRLGFVPPESYSILVTTGDAAYAHDQVELRVGGATKTNITTAAGEFTVNLFRVGQGLSPGGDLDVVVRDLGGADPNAVVNALQMEPIHSVTWDFGTATSPVAAPAVRATNAAYRPRDGIGWTRGTVIARDRGNANDLARDLVATSKGTLVVDVPRGTHAVTLVLGDSAFAHDQMKVTFEGEEIGVFSTKAMEFVSASGWIEVLDGQLTIEVEDVGGTDAYVAMISLYVQ